MIDRKIIDKTWSDICDSQGLPKESRGAKILRQRLVELCKEVIEPLENRIKHMHDSAIRRNNVHITPNYLVVIRRDKTTEVTPFKIEGDAWAYRDQWGTQWSEAYVCKILGENANE